MMRSFLRLPALLAVLIISGCHAHRPATPAHSPPPIAAIPAPVPPAMVRGPVRIVYPVPACANVCPALRPETPAVAVEDALDWELLDSLLTNVEARLDTVQRLTAPHHIERISDTLPPGRERLATVGPVDAIWWRDSGHVPIAVVSRKLPEVAAPAAAPAPVPLVPLKPCFYDPRGWPAWLLVALAAGLVAGAAAVAVAIKRA